MSIVTTKPEMYQYLFDWVIKDLTKDFDELLGLYRILNDSRRSLVGFAIDSVKIYRTKTDMICDTYVNLLDTDSEAEFDYSAIEFNKKQKSDERRKREIVWTDNAWFTNIHSINMEDFEIAFDYNGCHLPIDHPVAKDFIMQLKFLSL